MIHVRFQGLVPRLHVRVVGHSMLAVQALHQSYAGQGLLESPGQELYAAITVQQRAGWWFALAKERGQVHLQPFE